MATVGALEETELVGSGDIAKLIQQALADGIVTEAEIEGWVERFSRLPDHSSRAKRLAVDIGYLIEKRRQRYFDYRSGITEKSEGE